MTRSFTGYHQDADYTPNDIGPIENSNGPEKWVGFEDGEIKRLEEMEKLSEAELDLITF